MPDTGQCQSKIDPRSRLRRKLEASWKATKWETYLLYCRTLYRPHMRWLHRRGRHWFRHFALIDGPEFDRCDWCGEIRHAHTQTSTQETP